MLDLIDKYFPNCNKDKQCGVYGIPCEGESVLSLLASTPSAQFPQVFADFLTYFDLSFPEGCERLYTIIRTKTQVLHITIVQVGSQHIKVIID